MMIRYKIAATLLGAALLVALVVVLSFWSYGQAESAAEARRHTSNVLSRSGALLSELRDADSGQRGYALTGDPRFLEPYLAVRDGIAGHLQELRRLTRIRAVQNHLDAMAPMVAARMAGSKARWNGMDLSP